MKRILALSLLCLSLTAYADALKISCGVVGEGAAIAPIKQIDFMLAPRSYEAKSIGEYALSAFADGDGSTFFGVSALDSKGNQVAGTLGTQKTLDFNIYTGSNFEDRLKISCRRLF
jgi:hypothetical protein